MRLIVVEGDFLPCQLLLNAHSQVKSSTGWWIWYLTNVFNYFQATYRMTDVMVLLTMLSYFFRRPYAGEELYRVTDVMALLRTSGRSTREMHAGGMKYTAAFQLVRHAMVFF